jgi:hypothetical protein
MGSPSKRSRAYSATRGERAPKRDLTRIRMSPLTLRPAGREEFGKAVSQRINIRVVPVPSPRRRSNIRSAGEPDHLDQPIDDKALAANRGLIQIKARARLFPSDCSAGEAQPDEPCHGMSTLPHNPWHRPRDLNFR